MPSLLVIDDDRTVLHLISQAFRDTDVNVQTAGSANEGLTAIKQNPPDAVLLDVVLPHTSGLETFQRIHAIDSRLPVIFITAGGDSDTAIEAMKLGAYDYVLKPLDLPRVRELVRQALEMRRMTSVPVGVNSNDTPVGDGDMLLGRSPQMLEIYKAIGRVAPQDVTVLIRGESGTGKELIARAIFQHSGRANGPFLAVNCAAIPDALLESELFGHEKGSFTSADSRRIGKFEQCSGGTIFLDEVGDMSPMVQSKVLRLLQEQRFERVGGNAVIETDVRIIAATNRELEKMCEKGDFRPDLYYRLNGFTIELPPLRERENDIRLLLDYFLKKFTRQMGKADLVGIAPETIDMLLAYRWPGNIREMQSVVRQMLLNATGPVIIPECLPEDIRHAPTRKAAAAAVEDDGEMGGSDLREFIDQRLAADSTNLYAETLELMERFLVARILRLTEGNQSKAAQVLGITRGSLRNKIRSLGISIGQVVSVDESEE
ncbi:MAG TPA: sigma-54 dependent transcriptional regulator [Planctomycetaceae bacterium]|nr:sigma-54 dependent transcriptional regulator [Planctomycetaceae bacterium]